MIDATTTNAARNHTTEVHVGKPSPSSGVQDDRVTTKVYFHEFGILSKYLGKYADTTFFVWAMNGVLHLGLEETEYVGWEVVSVLLACYSRQAVNVEVPAST